MKLEKFTIFSNIYLKYYEEGFEGAYCDTDISPNSGYLLKGEYTNYD